MAPLPTPNAPRTVDEVAKLLKDDDKVKIAALDVDGVLRGKILSKDKFLSAVRHGFGFASSLFGWDINDDGYTTESLIANEANGFRDLQARIDLATYRRLPWEANMPFFLVVLGDPDSGAALSVDPRSLMSKVQDQAKGLGWTAIAGAELEYYQFKETPHTAAEKGFYKLTALTPGNHGYSMIRPTLNSGYFHDLYDEAARFGIAVECHHTETGPGVYESALAYTEAERMADNAMLFKLLAKSVGVKHGIMPTFMAKPYAHYPGSSGHIHVSLRDAKGRNVFASPAKREGAHKDLQHISQEAEWFLAGLVRGLPDVVPMMCPNINSYKRLIGGSAMWAPDTASYGYENRKVSIRIISPPSCPPEGTRFEVRVPGADMNAHYALGAIFALGLDGIKNKATLPYGPLGTASGCSTRDEVVHLPITLDDALLRFAAKDSRARALFGGDFVDHYAGTRYHEIGVHRRAVTSWELERYFELA